jgi:guanylate kinase
MLFVVSGPSGCGKSTLIGRILAGVPGVGFSISHTTRDKREGEIDGREYHFVEPREFEAMIGREEFVEWATVHGRYYGTSRTEVEAGSRAGDLVLDIDVQGARQIRARFGGKAVFVFIMPPVFDELRRRLVDRGTDSSESVARRLKNAREEIRAFPEFDFVVVNEDLETAVGDLLSIVRASRCRVEFRRGEMSRILQSYDEGEGKP